MEKNFDNVNATNQSEKNNRDVLLIIAILLIILIFVTLLMSYKLGKIGYTATSSEEVVDIIDVTEKDISWDLLEHLNIFNNVKFNNQKIIAPGNSSPYNFLVRNTTDENIVYDLQLREINQYGVNMKYKLKLANVYVCDSDKGWQNLENINLENVVLPPNSANYYTIEWCWVDNPNDTKIGALDYADYTLRVKIGAEYYNKEF